MKPKAERLRAVIDCLRRTTCSFGSRLRPGTLSFALGSIVFRAQITVQPGGRNNDSGCRTFKEERYRGPLGSVRTPEEPAGTRNNMFLARIVRGFRRDPEGSD